MVDFTQPMPRPVRRGVMAPNYTWHDLDEAGGVLELHERLTEPAPALELELETHDRDASDPSGADDVIRGCSGASTDRLRDPAIG